MMNREPPYEAAKGTLKAPVDPSPTSMAVKTKSSVVADSIPKEDLSQKILSFILIGGMAFFIYKGLNR
jgi:hypothetical protein